MIITRLPWTLAYLRTDENRQMFPYEISLLFDELADHQTIERHVAMTDLLPKGITWMIHSVRYEILRELPLRGESVIIETWPSGISGIRYLRDFKMYTATGEPIVRLTSEWLVIDVATRRPIRPFHELLEFTNSNSAIPHELYCTLKPENFTPDLDFAASKQMEATYMEIDANHHVTHSTYPLWMYAALPYQFLSDNRLVDLEIIYQHEVLPGSTVASQYAVQSTPPENNDTDPDTITIYHRIMSLDGEKCHALGRTKWTKKVLNL